MIHRRILADDGRGVSEALNERDKSGNGLTTYVTHYLLFSMGGTPIFQFLTCIQDIIPN
jgi:hypothetical protein